MLRFLILSFSLFFLVSCQQKDPNLDFDDSRNPFYKKAESDLEARNYPDAVKDYEDALQANPKLINAHYELGRIYSDKLGDQISAMYHYRKYLDLNPTAENHDKVQALLDNEKISFAATLPNSPVQNAEAFAHLQSENMQLKKELEQKSSGTTDTAASDTSATTVAPSNPAPTTTTTTATDTTTNSSAAANANPPAAEINAVPATAVQPANNSAPSAGGQSYTIKAGDTLWRIASKFYPGNSRSGVDRIKQANASILADNKPLKIGTVITIP